MKCEVYRVEIEEREAGGALSAGTSRHVDACASCRKLYEERAALERLLGGLKRVEAPNDFEFRLRARLAEGESVKRAGLLRRGFVPGVVSIALAAVFFVTATLTLQLRPTVDRRPASVASHAPSAAPEELATAETDEGDAVQASENVSSGGAASRAQTRGVSERRRAVVVAAVATKEESAPRSRRERFGSSESLFRPAPYVNSSGANQIALANPPVAVPLHASPQPLKVVLSDERGGARVVHMKSVSFGAQQLVGRAKENVRVTSAPQEGAW